jgi:hypothetical protein
LTVLAFSVLISLIASAREFSQSLFSSAFSPLLITTIKKGKVVLCSFALAYGRFLSISIISIAPIMTMMIAITATPNSTVDVDARPVGGEAVGAGVAGGLLA